MQRFLRDCSATGCLTILLCVLVEVGSARELGTLELGIDAAVSSAWIGSSNTPHFAVDMPAQSVRIGVFVSDYLQVEPAVLFALTSTKVTTEQTLFSEAMEERSTDHAVGLGIALAGHLSNDWASAVPFLKLEPAFLIVAQPTPEWQFSLGVGGGVKLPLGSRWAGRVALDVAHSFEREGQVSGAWVAALKVGFAYFTK